MGHETAQCLRRVGGAGGELLHLCLIWKPVMDGIDVSIGRPVERVEDLRLLRGRGRFISDISETGQLHAMVLRSSMAHGVVNTIDASDARKLPGVKAVITAKDLQPSVPRIPVRLFPIPEVAPFEQPVIADGKV